MLRDGFESDDQGREIRLNDIVNQLGFVQDTSSTPKAEATTIELTPKKTSMFTSRYQNQLDDLKSVCSEKRAFKSNEKSSLMLDKALESTKSTIA